MVNVYHIHDPLSVLPGNEQDLGHESIVNTYVFYQVCMVHDIVCFGYSLPINAREVMTLWL